MPDLLIIALRTVFLYFLVIFILRVMGKREVGELSVIDVVVFVIMAEVVAFSLDSPDKKLSTSLVPLFILLFSQLLTSYLSLKSKKFRDLVDGDPVVIIENGIIAEENMRKQRYNLDDLFQQLREKQIGSIQEVSYAYLEPSGNLSVFKKSESQPVLSLIADGIIQDRHLMLIKKDQEWLLAELKKCGVNDPQHIFYCSYENDKLFYQLKEDFSTASSASST